MLISNTVRQRAAFAGPTKFLWPARAGRLARMVEKGAKTGSSHDPRRRAVRRLADSATQLLEPFRFILSVNNSAEEPQRFGSIVTIEADVPPRCLGILPDPVLHISRPRKHVGGVSSLGHLDDYRLLEIEY